MALININGIEDINGKAWISAQRYRGIGLFLPPCWAIETKNKNIIQGLLYPFSDKLFSFGHISKFMPAYLDWDIEYIGERRPITRLTLEQSQENLILRYSQRGLLLHFIRDAFTVELLRR